MSIMPRATGSPQGPDGPSRGLRGGAQQGHSTHSPHSPHGWRDEPRAFTPTFSRELWGRGGLGGTTTSVPAGASPQRCPSTGSGALPGRCCHCSSPQALQTAQGKVFNLSSYFNLKCEKKNEKRMAGCRRLQDDTAPRLLQLHGRGQAQQWEPPAAALGETLELKSAPGTELQGG